MFWQRYQHLKLGLGWLDLTAAEAAAVSNLLQVAVSELAVSGPIATPGLSVSIPRQGRMERI